jgi:hypothetical protein
MPSYITSPQPTQLLAIYPGNAIPLVKDASVDTGVTKTQQLAFGPAPGNSVGNMVIVNQTNQQAQGQYSPDDTKGDTSYENLSGCVIPAGSALPYNLTGGWIRFTYTVAPTTGTLTVTR